MIHNGIEYTQIPYAPTYYISRCGKVATFRRGTIKNISICIDDHGYCRVNIINLNNKRLGIRLHRLLCNTFMSLDITPNPNSYMMVVNHIDRNKLNNDLSNLEVITTEENSRHSSIMRNKYGIGVSFRDNRYIASLCVKRKQVKIGYYKTPEQAHKAYIDAFIRYGLRDKYVEQLPAYKEAMMLKGIGVSIV